MPRVAVIGGGPAGLIAAETLADSGAQVTVYEHRRSVGRKFLLAGRSGLNLTHGESLDQFVERFGPQSRRLEPALRAFTPDDLRAWSSAHGEPTFVGTSQRVFPESHRATQLLRSWLRELQASGVEFETEHRWTGWTDDGSLVFTTGSGTRVVAADAALFALGGASWPRVGSDGSWAATFSDVGIAVADLDAANCGVMVDWTSSLRDRFAGEPIKNAVFSVGDRSVRGDAVITSTGLEGGPIYALGPQVRERLGTSGTADLRLDLHPDLSEQRLGDRLSRRRTKASATSWLHSAGIAPISVALARDATQNQLPDEPAAFARLLKAMPVRITSLAALDRAISTAGGVSFDEVNDDFMLTSHPGNFVAGEMLDWEAPTGGYLLQACFSTGVAAAHGALTWCAQRAAN